MSLEQAIQENTAALLAFTIALNNANQPTAKVSAPAETKKSTAATASSPSGAKQKTTDQKETAPAGDAIEYDAVKKPFLALASTPEGREKAIAILGKYEHTQEDGVVRPAAKLIEVAEADWAKVLADVRAAQAGDAELA